MNLLLATFGEVMSYIGYVLLALLILLVMITVHELGHYIAGKILKFKINEFAIGFGPKLFSKTKKDGEVFSVRLLPIGGFCAFHGEDDTEEEDNQKEDNDQPQQDGQQTEQSSQQAEQNSQDNQTEQPKVDKANDPTTFNNQAPWKRLIVLVSGALMNYLLALLVIIFMFAVYGNTALVTHYIDGPTSEYVQEYSFYKDDVILKANGKNVYLATDLMNAISGKNKNDKVNFTLLRQGKVVQAQITLRGDTHFNNLEDFTRLYKALGIPYELDAKGQIAKSGLYSTGVKYGFFDTIGRSFEYSFNLAATIFKILGQLITGNIGLSSMGGTVTTISVTANAIKVGGFRNLLNIASFIGVNLAVFNLLPIPALDGSKVVFTTIEWIRKKPINRKVENIIHTVGLVLILIFAIFIDLQRCF